MRLGRVSGRRLLLFLFLAAVAVPNFYAIIVTVPALLRGDLVGADWFTFTTAADLVGTDALYRFEGGAYRHSPLFAYAFGVIAVLGPLTWRVLHILVLALLPTWRLAAISLLFFPFWADLFSGNVLTFAFVAAATAIAGSRIGTGAYLGLVALIPQPILLPVAAWLLWQRRSWRWPFIGAVAAHAIIVAVTGLGDDWLLAVWGSALEIGAPIGIGPSRLIGWLWIPLGLGVAAWCTLRGRLGFASLYASPVWLHFDPLMVLLQLVPQAPREPAAEGRRVERAASTEPAAVRVQAD